MNNDLIEKYKSSKTWHERVLIMSAFHGLRQSVTHESKWTIRHTAKEFDVSAGLVSENLQLAEAIRQHQEMLQAPDRQAALKLLKDYK